MNTTENATNPRMPPKDLKEWDTYEPGMGWYAHEPFMIDCTADGRISAWLRCSDRESRTARVTALRLGRHPDEKSAVMACRDVAGALQRARRHDQPEEG